MGERCSDCGGPLDVGYRQKHRIRTGRSTSRCSLCRGRPQPIATETDYRFWASAFGVKIPTGTPALEHLTATGLPAGLADLACEFVADSQE